ERQFGQIELAVRRKAGETFVVAEIQPRVVDAFRVDETQSEVAEMVVVSGGDGKRQARHGSVASMVARSCGVTSGSRSNQSFHAMQAWWSSMPRPSTVGLPRRRATASSGVSSGI